MSHEAASTHAERAQKPTQPGNEVLGSQVRQSFLGSDRTYGARRVWHDVLALGQQCGLHRVERLMREQALRARPRRRGLPQDGGTRSAIADNVLDRQFRADAPNQKWVADFTTSLTSGRLKVRCTRLRCSTCTRVACRLVNAGEHDLAARCRRANDGRMAPWRAGRVAASLRPTKPNTAARTSSSCSRNRASPAACESPGAIQGAGLDGYAEA